MRAVARGRGRSVPRLVFFSSTHNIILVWVSWFVGFEKRIRFPVWACLGRDVGHALRARAWMRFPPSRCIAAC